MKIVFENKEMLKSEKIYLHNSYFKQINYNDENKILYVICQDYNNNKIKTIHFYNVIYFEMQNGYYWGKMDGRIINWELEEGKYGLNRLKQLYQENNGDLSELNKLKYIDSVFLSCEGNKFTIVCEEIEYNERDTIN